MGQYTTNPELATLARNTKEEFEIIRTLFIGNELWNEETAVDLVKFIKIVDTI
jgi:hypothetical protein